MYLSLSNKTEFFLPGEREILDYPAPQVLLNIFLSTNKFVSALLVLIFLRFSNSYLIPLLSELNKLSKTYLIYSM